MKSRRNNWEILTDREKYFDKNKPINMLDH